MNVMRFFRFPRACRLAALPALAASCAAFAHDGDQAMLRDAQVPYPGKIWTSRNASEEGGIADVSFPSNNIQLLAWMPINTLDPSSTSASVVEGYVTPAGKEIAIIGVSGGTAFVNVTDPGAPQFIKFIPSVSSLWRDIRVFSHYCYTVSEGGNGIQVIDLGQIDNGTVTALGTVQTGGSTATHTVFINQDSGYLYRCGGGSTLGLRIYNLNANPATPPFVTTAISNRYVHECQVVTYTSGPYAGKEIAFCYTDAGSGGGSPVGIDIVDVTVKQNIVPLSFISYQNARFSHQGWLSPDKHYLYQDDELDEQQAGQPTLTRIFDVSNLSAPTFVTSFGNGLGAIDHNQYTKGNRLFQSNYRSGLRVWDTTNPIAPVEIGSFDTYPPDNNPSFNGLWDNYPYLPSGIVLGSDIEKGLFIWSIGPDLLSISFPGGNPALIPASGGAIPVTIASNSGTLQPGTAKLNYKSSGGFVSVDLVSNGGDSFTATFPPLPCGAEVKYYISAQTTTGVTVRSPAGAPNDTYAASVASDVTTGASDDMEAAAAWTVGAPGDAATTGVWVRVNPIGTAAQPEDDHTPGSGVNCWVTGQGVPGGSVGDADVDGGATTLTSPALDATGGDLPQLTYWRWYSNNAGSNPGTNTMPILLSNDNGANWTQVELVGENAGAWVKKSIKIEDVMTPTAQMKVRFVARDLNGAVVEAGVDDLSIEYFHCDPMVAGDITGDGVVDIDDLFSVINAWGSCPTPPDPCPADVAVDGVIDVDDLFFVINHWS